MTQPTGPDDHGGPAGPPPRPRWVVVLLGFVVLVAVVLVVSALLGVEHGPGRHGGGHGRASLDSGVLAPAGTAPAR